MALALAGPHVIPARRFAGGRSVVVRPAPTVRTYRRRRLFALLATLATALLLVTVASRAAATLRDVPASVSEGRPAPALSTEPAGASTGASAGAAGAASSVGSRLAYVVQPGDTIWSIARRLQPTGDVRALVDALVERNGGAALDVGQRLAVP